MRGGLRSGTPCSPKRPGPTWGIRGAATSAWRWPSRLPRPAAGGRAAEVARQLQLAGRDDLAGPRWRRAARHARSLGALPEAVAFWPEAARCDPDDGEPLLELAEAHAWLGQDADFEQAWQAALELFRPQNGIAAWCRRGDVVATVLCIPRPRSPPTGGPRSCCPRTRRGAACSGTARGWPGMSRLPGTRPAPSRCWPRSAALATEPDAEIARRNGERAADVVMRLGRFAECEAVARAARSSRAAGRPHPAFAGRLDDERARWPRPATWTAALRTADARWRRPGTFRWSRCPAWRPAPSAVPAGPAR